MSAALVLVATPIGNLGDLSARAARELAGADVIACEDTRRTGRLLSLAGIAGRPPLLRLDDHTEAARTGEILDRLQRGERVVVVSDAGTPGVSDPGERLVRAALDAGHVVEVVPGPAAAITALVGSGLTTNRFCFEGFLPRKGAARAARLAQLATEERTIVLYESPHRLGASLADMLTVWPATRRVVIARELTKLHEQWWRGSLADAHAWVLAHPPRGEVVVVVDGAGPPATAGAEDVEAALGAALAAGATVKDAASLVSTQLAVAKRTVYEVAVRMAAERRPPSCGTG